MGFATRFTQRQGRMAVRARLGGRAQDESGRRKAEVSSRSLPTSVTDHSRKRIEVVAAVIERADGCFLLAQRPAGKVYAGYWEFPGGKVEPGETAPNALQRELHEEL